MTTTYNRLAVLAISMAAISAGAKTVSTPASYIEDFSTMGAHGDALPADWKTYGNGEKPLTEWQQYFGEGEGPFYRLLNFGGVWGAFSNSSFIENIPANEWLTTPKIHINSDSEILLVTAGGYGSAGLEEYRIFVSETGNAKEDFTKAPIVSSYVYGGGSSSLHTKQQAVHLDGYGGKDIYLAFVNRNVDKALFGITEIMVAPYCISVTDNTPQVLPEGTDTNISLTVDLRTPVSTSGLKATLTTSTGITSTLDRDQTITIAGKQFQLYFPKSVTVPAEGFTYKVELTPNIEGAEPTVIEGSVSTPKGSYTPVAVIEEMTGSWCGFCPRGAAFLEYFTDTYDSDQGRVIGIAVHQGDNMEIPDGQYINTLYSVSGATGYPGAYFQRTVQNDPATPTIINMIMNQTCYSAIRIESVNINDETEGNFEVKFSVENAYDKEELGQRVAFVVVENNVKGSDPTWNQTNGYSGATQSWVAENYGADLWPYFQLYAESPTSVPFSEMVYQHVARGIYPNYFGAPLEGSCTAQKKVEFNTTFECPSTVADKSNLALVALLLDENTGAIITADEMPAWQFNSGNAVARLTADDVIISAADGALSVKASSAMTVDVYGIDGMARDHYASENGELTVDPGTFDGIMIVKVTTANGVCMKKIAF